MEFIDLTSASEAEKFQVKGILSNASRNLEFTCGNKLKTKDNVLQNGNQTDNNKQLDQQLVNRNNQKPNSNSLQTNNSNSLDSSPISNASHNSNKNGYANYHNNNNLTNSHNSMEGDNQPINNNNHYSHNHNNINHQNFNYNYHNHNRGAIPNQHLPNHYSTQHFLPPNGQYNGQPDSHHHLNHQYKIPYYTPSATFTNSSKPFYPTNAYNSVLTSIAPITTQNGLIITSNQQLHTTTPGDEINPHLNNQRANLNIVVSTSENPILHSYQHPINGYHAATSVPPNPSYPHMQPTAQYIPAPHPMFYIHPLPMTQFYPAHHYAPPQIATAQPTTILTNSALHQQLATPPISPAHIEQDLSGGSNELNATNCDLVNKTTDKKTSEAVEEVKNINEQVNNENDNKKSSDLGINQIELKNEAENISNISFLSPESLDEKQDLKESFKFTEDISDVSFTVSSIDEKSESSLTEEKEAEINDSKDYNLTNNISDELNSKLEILDVNENENESVLTNDSGKEEANKTEPNDLAESVNKEEEKSNEASNQQPTRSWADLFKSNKDIKCNKPNTSLSIASKTSDLNLFSTNDFEPLGQHQIDTILKNTSKLQQTIKSVPLEEDEIFPKLAKKISNLVLKHSLPLLDPRGFTNQSNWCYINSILQALLYCPPFYNLMREIGETPNIFREKSATPVIDSFAKFFTNFMPNEDLMRKIKTKNGPFNYDELRKLEPFEPKCIYNVLGNINNQCLKGNQEDAEEFFSSVLNCLNEEMLSLINFETKRNSHKQQQQKNLAKNNSPQNENSSNCNNTELETSSTNSSNSTTGKPNETKWLDLKNKQHKISPVNSNKTSTPISNIFGGSMLLIRTAGKDVNQCRQPFFTLQLNINNDKIRTVEDALRNLVSSETIHGYTCPKTNKTIEASCQTLLNELPIILVLHVKLNNEDNTKIMKKINFQVDLEIPKECLTVQDRSRYSKTYKLLSVVHHDGRKTNNGHYITDIYHIGTNLWLRCDDSKIESISVKELTHPHNLKVPYLLFYRRCDTLRGSNKS